MANLVSGENTFLYLCIAIGVPVCLAKFFTSESWKLRHIPTLGFSGWPGFSIISTFQYILNGDKLLLECHNRYTKAFKIASLNEYLVVVHGGVEDIRESMKFSTSVASSSKFTDQFMHLEYIIGKTAIDHPYAIAMVQRLSRNVVNKIPELLDEAEASLNSIISSEDDWNLCDLEETCDRIVAQVTMRTAVGKTICRNPKFSRTCLQFKDQATRYAMTLNVLVPRPLFPVANYFLKGTKPSLAIIREFVEPIIKQSPCWYKSESNEKKSETPLDWLIDLAEGHEDEYTIEGLTERVALLAFASIVSTSTLFRTVLYNLAAYPEYIPILREEAERVISEDGWSKSAFDNMMKIESFIQESHRTAPIANIAGARLMMKDHTLRDGTFLPQGTVVVHWVDGINADEEIFEDAARFDGLRYYKMRQTGERIGLTDLTPRFHLFGLGKQACPGRFFAAIELKLLTSYILLNFDIKASPEKVSTSFGLTLLSNVPARGKVLLRRRKSE